MSTGALTSLCSKLFTEVFPASNVTVQAHGNVLAAMAFLHGLLSEDCVRTSSTTSTLITRCSLLYGR